MTPEQRIAQLEYKVARSKSALGGALVLASSFSWFGILQLPLNLQVRISLDALVCVVLMGFYFLILRHVEWEAKRRYSN